MKKIRTFPELDAKAGELGLTVTNKNGGTHWQIRGHKSGVIVNYYPTTGMIYVNGQAHGLQGTANQALHMAQGNVPEGMQHERLSARQSAIKRNTLYNKQAKPLIAGAPPMVACCWCGKPMSRREASVEHIIPLSRGGSNHDNNLKLACKPCNNRRGNMIGVKEDL